MRTAESPFFNAEGSATHARWVAGATGYAGLRTPASTHNDVTIATI